MCVLGEKRAASTCVVCVFGKVRYKATLKKSLFPVQRVAEIVASRASAKKKKIRFFFFGKKMMKLTKK